MNNSIISKKRFLVSLLLGVMVIIMLGGCGRDDSKKTPAPSGSDAGDDTFAIISAKEEQGIMTVTTSFGSFAYPTEFAKGVHVKASTPNEIPTLIFTIQLNDRETSLFTICYGGKEGIPCGTFKLPENDKIVPVYVTFLEVPSDLSSDERVSFEMAQEVFNDVIISMEEDPRFEGV